MTNLLDIFKQSKAHKLNLDYRLEAEALYREIAEDLKLELIKRPNDPVELSMEFPKQPNLNIRVWVCLQNLDELWFSTDYFTCSMFPFEEIKDEFAVKLRGFLSGGYRIRKFIDRKSGKVKQSLLQRPTERGWETVSTYGLKFLPDQFFKIEDDSVNCNLAAKNSM